MVAVRRRIEREGPPGDAGVVEAPEPELAPA